MRNLQVQQKKAEQSIRAAAKRNDEKSMRVLAKELVRSRQAVVRMLQDQGTLDALDLQMSESLRNYRLSKTFESSGRMMKEMNKLVRIDRYQETVKAMQKEMYGQFENTFMMYLPRLCEHCLNPTCVAACPSGAIYKREDDGIVLIDQEKCRGWRMCVSACPYKKVYFNHATGKAENKSFCEFVMYVRDCFF